MFNTLCNFLVKKDWGTYRSWRINLDLIWFHCSIICNVDKTRRPTLHFVHLFYAFQETLLRKTWSTVKSRVTQAREPLRVPTNSVNERVGAHNPWHARIRLPLIESQWRGSGDESPCSIHQWVGWAGFRASRQRSQTNGTSHEGMWLRVWDYQVSELQVLDVVGGELRKFKCVDRKDFRAPIHHDHCSKRVWVK